ncbi:MAG: hypothetical protein IJY36_05145 [Coprobacter sp.]|nr:hypothetical protein [Coprobacter sp.]
MKKFLFILALIVCCNMQAATNYKKQIYDLFITGNILQWEEVINKMKGESATYSLDENIELITYYYGLSGHLMGKDDSKAKELIEEALDILKPLLKKNPENASLLGLSANLHGYQIAINPIKAATLAHSMLVQAKRAPKLAPEDPEANIWGANILFYMPNALGGNTKQAKVYYNKALQLYESDESLRADNWMYLQLIVTLGLVEEKAENYTGALEYFHHVCELFPSYPYVREVLIPRVEEKRQNAQ